MDPATAALMIKLLDFASIGVSYVINRSGASQELQETLSTIKHLQGLAEDGELTDEEFRTAMQTVKDERMQELRDALNSL